MPQHRSIGLYLTRIGGIIGQADGEVIALGKLQEALHELRPPAVALWAIVQIDNQRRDMSKARFDALPPVAQPIDQAIARDFGRHPVQKEFIGGGQENAYRRHRRHVPKVMVGSPGSDATLTSPCERADLDGGLGIYRNPEHVLIGIRLLVALLHLGKDGVGLGKFFWG
jgi:hypothetical protein